jgi:predicted AAA+ superfamily ATPase
LVFKKGGALYKKKIIISAELPVAQDLILGLFKKPFVNFSTLKYSGISLFEVLPDVDNSLFRLWLRGRYKESLQGSDDVLSTQICQNLILNAVQGILNKRELQLIRLLRTIASVQGQHLNSSLFSGLLDVSHVTVRSWINLLEKAGLIYIVNPLTSPDNRRVFKTPRIYIADTGILHSLLNITSVKELMSHPVCLESWKTFILNECLYADRLNLKGFYRTSYGTGIDFILNRNSSLLGLSAGLKVISKKIKGLESAVKSMNIKRFLYVVPNLHKETSSVFHGSQRSTEPVFMDIQGLKEFFASSEGSLDKIKDKVKDKTKDKIKEDRMTLYKVKQISLFNQEQ